MTQTSPADLARQLAARVTPVWQPIAVGIAAVAATMLVAAVDPHEAGHYPTCPSLYLTGFWCPGCGSLRAVHDLAHGDLVGALGMNILLVLAVPYLLWRWGTWLVAAMGHPLPRRLAPGWAIWTLLSVILVFTVARNIPAFGPLLAP